MCIPKVYICVSLLRCSAARVCSSLPLSSLRGFSLSFFFPSSPFFFSVFFFYTFSTLTTANVSLLRVACTYNIITRYRAYDFSRIAGSPSTLVLRTFIFFLHFLFKLHVYSREFWSCGTYAGCSIRSAKIFRQLFPRCAFNVHIFWRWTSPQFFNIF